MTVLTPWEQHAGHWVKRDDLFELDGSRGGKVRSCLDLVQDAGPVQGLVTAGSRRSPQVNIVATVAQHLGLPCRVHIPEAKGPLTPELQAAQDRGAEVVGHRPGYNSVIVTRAKADAEARGWLEVPFGMECEQAVTATAAQTANLPTGLSRLVIPVGSGMSLAGVLWGLQEAPYDLPVLGVTQGAPAHKRLDRWAPENWRDLVTLVDAGVDYHTEVHAKVGDLLLDPVYEAKCARFLEPGDALWVVGCRETASGT